MRRIVLLSSNHATDWYETSGELFDGRLPASAFPASVDFYGWARAAIELLTIPYALGTFGREMEVVILRVGAPRELVFEDYVVCDSDSLTVDLDSSSFGT